MNLAKKYKQLFEGKIRSNDAILLKEALNLSSVKSQLLALSKKYPGYANGLADYMDSGIPEDAYRDIQGGNKATAEKFYNLAVAIVHNVDPTFDVSDGKPFAPGDPNEPKGFDTESEAFEKIGFFEGKGRSNDAALLTEALARGLKPLLTIGTTITKNDGEDALLDLSDKFDRIDDEYAGEIASWLDMAIELMQDGYAGDATKKLKEFNKACKDVLRGKPIKSAFA
jgi:hypothetical protein